MRVGAWLAIGLTYVTVGAPAVAVEIPLTVQEPAGVARQWEPLTCGVPLPSPMPGASWSLYDGATEIPVQATPLIGRTPWLLLDFQMNLGPQETRTLYLRDSPPNAAPRQLIRIQQLSGQVSVETGPLRVLIGQLDFDLFDGVWLDRNADGAFTADEQVITSTGDDLTIVDATTGSTFIGRGAPDRFEWEYVGPLRATLRVDGRYRSAVSGEYIAYTTRMTFFAGRTDVRIEHTLRNSYQPNIRHVKYRSAQLRIGSGGATMRTTKDHVRYWQGVGGSGARIELLPPTQDVTNLGADVGVDANGGWLLPDLTHDTRAWVVDFAEGLSASEQTARAAAVRSPLFALAPPDWYSEYGGLTASKFSTLDDERGANRLWGWTWQIGQEPSDPPKPDYMVYWWPDVHEDTESDDLWQNITMYLRTGSRGYWDRAGGWSWYFKNHYGYRTDGFEYASDGDWEAGPKTYLKVPRPEITIPLTSTDQTMLQYDAGSRVHGDHLYGWGLLDYYCLTGDVDALEAAVDIGDISIRAFQWRDIDPDNYRLTNYGLRDDGRNLLCGTRLWEITQDARWWNHIQHIALLVQTSDDWDTRGAYLQNRGGSDPWLYKVLSPFENGILATGMYRYYLDTGDSIIRDHLVRMADFAVQYALHSQYQYSGYFLDMDYPNPGDVWHQNFDGCCLSGFDPLYTITWCDLLDAAYRITNDSRYLQRAKYYWDRGSKARYGDPTVRTAGDLQVGRFLNSSFQGSGPYYSSNGDLPYVSMLFYDFVHSGPVVGDTVAPSPPQTLRAR